MQYAHKWELGVTRGGGGTKGVKLTLHLIFPEIFNIFFESFDI